MATKINIENFKNTAVSDGKIQQKCSSCGGGRVKCSRCSAILDIHKKDCTHTFVRNNYGCRCRRNNKLKIE